MPKTINLKLGIYILLILLIDISRSKGALTISEIAFSITFCGVLMGWLLKLLLQRRNLLGVFLKNPPLFYSMFLLFLVSPIMALGNAISLQAWFLEWRMWVIILLFYIIKDEFYGIIDIKKLLYILTFVALAIAMRENLTALNILRSGQILRLGPVSGESFLYIAVIPLILVSFISSRTFIPKAVSLLGLIVVVFRIITSITRGLFLSFLLVWCASLLVYHGIKKKQIYRGILVLNFVTMVLFVSLISFFTISAQKYYMANRLKSFLIYRFVVLTGWEESISVQTRLNQIQASLRYIINHPLWGYGFGSTYSYYSPEAGLTYTSLVHTIPLYIFLKSGIFGFLLSCWFVLRSLTVALKAFKREHEIYTKLVVGALTIGIVSYCITSFYETYIISIDDLLGFIVMTGVTESIWLRQKRENLGKQSSLVSTPKDFLW